jgi:antitoxin ParD1/3/4
MAISVDLSPALEKVMNDLVSAGRYGSKSEVLREGLRLVQEREAQLQKLKAELKVGLDQLDAGLGLDADQVFDELEAELAAMSNAVE